MFYGLVGLTVIHFWQQGIDVSFFVFFAGIVQFLFGFGIALWATGYLGWRQAFGVKEGLRTKGIFSLSRHPVYVATWVGMAGWFLMQPDQVVRLVLVEWALIYLLAIFLEERWLLSEFGDSYETYAKKTPRFFGLRGYEN